MIVLYGGKIYIEEEILGNLDINSKLGFLISGVVNFPLPFLGLIKRHLVAAKGFFYFFLFLRRKAKTALAEGINICFRSKGRLYEDNHVVYKITLFRGFHLLWKN